MLRKIRDIAIAILILPFTLPFMFLVWVAIAHLFVIGVFFDATERRVNSER